MEKRSGQETKPRNGKMAPLPHPLSNKH